MPRKISMSKTVKEQMVQLLVNHTLAPQYNKMCQEVTALSDKVYERVISKDLESNLRDLGLNPADWVRHGDEVNTKFAGFNFPVALEKFGFNSFSEWFHNKLNSYQVPIYESQLGYEVIKLHFSTVRIVPLNNTKVIFELTETEAHQYNKIMSKWIKKFDKLFASLSTAITIINSNSYFEDLFNTWPASEKMFKQMYVDRQSVLLNTKVKYLPSVDLDKLSEDLNL